MKKIFFLICITGLLIALTSCDEREGVKPIMQIDVDNNHLYSDGIDCELNYTDIHFHLEGSPGFISEAKILVDYDRTKGLFVGTGSSQFIITDESGYAKGMFVAEEGELGYVTLEARMETFASVNETIIIALFDLPDISMESDSEIIPSEGTAQLQVVLTDLSGNVTGQEINFTADTGTLEHNTVETDANGSAANTFFAGNETGPAIITATFAKCENVSDSVTIIIE